MKTLNEAVKEVYAAVAAARAIADETGQELVLHIGDQTLAYQPPKKEGVWNNWYSSNC